MGETTELTDEIKNARAVLTRSVIGPQMAALRELAKARKTAADPQTVRQIARRRAAELVENARRKGKELVEQAERDIAAGDERVREAYQGCLNVGWTVELLAEADQPPPPPARRGRRSGRRSSSSARVAKAASADDDVARRASEPVTSAEPPDGRQTWPGAGTSE